MIISNIKNLILRKHCVMSLFWQMKKFTLIKNKVKTYSHASLRIQCFYVPAC